ncbi:MAG: Glycosyl hydrolase family 20, domain 2 [Lentisphaerae bacterium ADurb.Bin242]|nr:MAG: Glycosyl hydrolase family 20, domain 2 [Lentisphaerae bacterium ADurb.Bin242]
MKHQEFQLFPGPKKMNFSGKAFPLPEKPEINLIFPAELKETAGVVAEELRKLIPASHISFNGKKTPDVSIHLETKLKAKQPEAYELTVRGKDVRINGATWRGIVCGLATLRQLMMKDGLSTGLLPEGKIADAPDVRWRAASRWLIDLEGNRMAYDWGDGRKEMLRRCREKIDFAMRHKINIAFFDGFSWNWKKYPQYASDMRALGKYAAIRNLSLEFGGYSIGVGGRNPEFKSVVGCGFQSGLGDLNRKSYPNGEPYKCMGKSEDHPTRYNGTCRSNDALNALKMKQLAEYVAQVEPRMLYIHPEDISHLEELASDWKLRCPDCRKRWPSDLPEAPDGAAGAQAYGMTKLYEAVASVKNPETGYDGAKDCLVAFVPAAYAGGNPDDSMYQRLVKQYHNIAALLPRSPNLLLLMREQFCGRKKNVFRTAAMMESSSRGIAMFAINGADSYTNGKLFAPGALLNSFYKGSELIFNFAGTLYQEPQEVFNAECCWNLPPLDPETVQQARTFSEQGGEIIRRMPETFSIPKALTSKNGFLTQFCRSFYGPEAGRRMIRLMKLGNDRIYPMTSILFRFDKQHLFDGSSHDCTKKFGRAELLKQWKNILRETGKARALAEGMKDLPPAPFVREILAQFARTLAFSERLAEIAAGIFAAKPDRTALLGKVVSARKFLKDNFCFRFTSPSEGEHSLWNGYLDRLENAVKTYPKES